MRLTLSQEASSDADLEFSWRLLTGLTDISKETTFNDLCKLVEGPEAKVEAFVRRSDGTVKVPRLDAQATLYVEHESSEVVLRCGEEWWAVYTIHFYQEEVQRIKDALDENWSPMFPGELPDSNESTELFKVLLAKRLSPSEVSVDPALEPNPGPPLEAFLKRKRNPEEETNSDRPYTVPQASYSLGLMLTDKRTWLSERQKQPMPDSLTGKPRAKARRKINNREHRTYKAQANGEVLVANDLTALKLRMSSTGWMGRSFPVHSGRAINRDWESLAINKKLESFLRVPYDEKYGRGTFIGDSGGRCLIFRSAIKPDTQKLHDEFVVSAADFVRKCQPETDANIAGNNRGRHWFCIAGYDRQNKADPAVRPWHVQNEHVIEEFFGSKTTAFSRISNMASTFVQMHFPKIAARYQENIDDIDKKSKGKIRPHFGLFWNFCLNSAYGNVPRVHCRPHVDSKNLAIGVCVLYIYGHFNSKERSWLCLWEAGIIIELPPGVFLVYPSALFYHFNIDMCDIDIRTTSDGQRPDRATSPKVFESGKGRGSCVWFNQASMFQTAKGIYKTLTEARKSEPNSNFGCDNEELVKKDFFPSIATLEALEVRSRDKGEGAA